MELLLADLTMADELGICMVAHDEELVFNFSHGAGWFLQVSGLIFGAAVNLANAHTLGVDLRH